MRSTTCTVDFHARIGFCLYCAETPDRALKIQRYQWHSVLRALRCRQLSRAHRNNITTSAAIIPICSLGSVKWEQLWPCSECLQLFRSPRCATFPAQMPLAMHGTAFSLQQAVMVDSVRHIRSHPIQRDHRIQQQRVSPLVMGRHIPCANSAEPQTDSSTPYSYMRPTGLFLRGMTCDNRCSNGGAKGTSL